MSKASVIKEQLTGFLLSPQQKRLWLLQAETGAGAYRAQCVVDLRGALRPELLKAASGRVVARHEILRTAFSCLPGMSIAVQVVTEENELCWREINLLGLPSEEQPEAVERLLAEDSIEFDFNSPPLLRLTLLTLAPEHHRLLCTLPALCADTRTLQNFVNELSNAYHSGTDYEDKEEVSQYLQFSEWQNELLGDAAAKADEYWTKQLAESGGQSSLPSKTQAAAEKYFAPDVISVELKPELSLQLRELAARHDTTLELVLMAGWQTLLRRSTGQAEVVVGRMIDGRRYEELQSILGLLASYAPVRCRFQTGARFDDILKQLRRNYAEAEEWEDSVVWAVDEACFDSLAPEVGFEFEPSRAPVQPGRVTFDVQYLYSCFDRFKLRLRCVEQTSSLRLQFHFDTSYFEGDGVETLAAQFQALLSDVVQRPDALVDDFESLGEVERTRLLVEFNRTQRVYPGEQCLHRMFEAQAARTPDNTAVVFEGVRLSYCELNASANQLAHHLRALGVGTDALVGVFMERSLEMVVGLLGVLKAGGAYVPLDSAYPKERLAFMLDDSRVRVLLTQHDLVGLLPEHSAQLVVLDTGWNAIAAESDVNPAVPVDAGNLAYVIYTSGSTGTPKGVMVPHAGVSNCINWMQETYLLDETDKFMLKTSLNFDPSVWELFWPLAIGASVIVTRPGGHQDAAYLVNAIAENEVTSIYFVPSMLRAFVEEPKLETCVSLKRVICGGESLPVETVARLFERTAAELHHSYGPTETSIAASEFTCERDKFPRVIPIGKPLGNTQLYTLNSKLRPVPLGVPGELYIGGEGLGRGYLNRAGLTAERFVPDVFSEKHGARLYKTGDLVRYLPDGNIVFIGRVDYQVKVRGYRIELEEIETVLNGHPAVTQCVVTVNEGADGNKSLTAYVVAGGELSRHELHEFMKERLPDYMIPAAFVVLEALPLMPNGKVDRKALPAPDSISKDSDALFIAPRTLTEELIASAWMDLLRVPRVSRYQSFFELGGHSLLATQLISRLRDLFSVELTLRTVFDSPVLADLAAAVDLARFGSEVASAVPFERVERDGPLPLSFAQQRLWFLDQLEPGTALYNVPAAVRLRGQLAAEALQRTLTEVVRRHESLRTTFTVEDGEPRQVIAEPEEFSLRVLDFSVLTPEVAEQTALRVVAEEAVRPFELATGPLLRVTLVQVSEQEHVAVLVMHHIISDGWSMGLLIGEVTRLYAAYASGAAVEPEELEWQYANYAAWQRRRLSGAILEEELSYWREQLAGAPAVLELATDRPRPAVPSYRGAIEGVELSTELTEGLRELSRKSGVTLFMTLLGGFQTLLWRYSGQKVVNVGTPVANRTRAEAEGIIGFFVNTLVVRGELDGGLRVRELLRQVREVCLGAYGHQEVPFERVVDELQPERSLSHTPLFQVSFTFETETGADGKFQLPGVEVSMINAELPISKFDLSLSLKETQDGVVGAFTYSTDLFDAETIRRMGRHLTTLLESMVADSNCLLHELPVLTEDDRRLLLSDWAGPAPEAEDTDAGLCLHQLFERQATMHANAVAVTCGTRQLTYAELQARSNQLAQRLRREGVGPEVVVGLMVERSIEMVVGLLAILKAGGAYVPLDPEYPAERLEYMLADAKVPVLLTQQNLLDRVSENSIRVLCLDSDWESLVASESSEPLPNTTSPDSVAYVIYTSGSTGKPKGVFVTHANVRRLFNSTYDWFNFGESDVWTMFHSYAFDFSVWEIWGAFLYGGRLVVVPYEISRTPELFYELLIDEGVTVLNQTPSGFRRLMAADEKASGEGRTNSLRLVIFGGEALEMGSLKPWFARHGDTKPQLVNMYGITETTVHVTYRPVSIADTEASGGSPIGRPIPNLQAYLLDEDMQLVPMGVAGELYIGGVQLARGYLGQAALTAERFVPHPFSAAAGARLYKTGDLARYRAGEEIEYLGRSDQQVKVRGFRIEPGEIEAALLTHPGVASALVLARPSEGGDMRLVAYLVMRAGVAEPPGAEELRRHLMGQLPDYMVPAYFVTLAELPLLPSGKVDRRALPEVESAGAVRERGEPRTEAERVLARVWAEVLGLERVGGNDNFFELGGDSILAIQVVARAAQSGLQLTAKQVFQHQTVAGLAAAATQAGETKVEAEQGEVSGAAVLTPVQRWFFERELAEEWHHNQAAMVELREGVQWEALAAAMSAAVNQHDALRLRFRRVESEWEQAAAAGAEACQVFELCDVSEAGEVGGAEAEQRAVAERVEQTQRGLRLSEGPVVRAVGFKRGEGRCGLLLVVAHHLVIDGVSWRVLLADVERGYEQAATGAAVELGAKTTSYKEWAQGLAAYAGRAEVTAESAFWQKALRRRVTPLRLDHEPQTNGHGRAAVLATVNTVETEARVTVSLNEKETKALLTEVPSAYRTQIDEILLTALACGYARWSGERRLLVDVEGHGREEDALAGTGMQVDLSRTVGWFTTIYPVVLELPASDDQSEAIKNIKEQVRAVPHKGLNYGVLRYLAEPAVREQMLKLPQAELVFNYLGQSHTMLREGGLFKITQEGSGQSRSKMDARSRVLEVDAVIHDGRLQMTWNYSRALHACETVEALAHAYMEALREVIAHCQSADAGGLTPSDIDADLSQQELDELLLGFSTSA